MTDNGGPFDISKFLSGSIGQKLYELAFQMTPVGMSFVTLDRRGVHCNPALCTFLGRTAEELQLIDIGSVTHPDDQHLHVDQHRHLMAGDLERYALDKRYIHKDGSTLWAHLEVALVRDDSGVPRMLLSQVIDIGAQVALAEQLRYRASHDALTGLGNRAELFVQIDKANESRLLGLPFAVLYLDMDGFKAINDQHGHAMGDRVLAHVATQIRATLGHDDFAARIGGDEFVVVSKHLSITVYAAELANRILESLRKPTYWDGHVFTFGASIGIAFGIGNGPDAILSSADEALYRAKRAGKNRVVMAG
jgi:diguanylate cyclase (GGDEF)-like protein/PAS domain S-box-containing protein